MKFERNQKAETIVNLMLGNMEPGKRMLVYQAVEGPWQFQLNYDEMHDQWTASYQEREVVAGKKYTAQPCEPPLAITGKKYRYYKTRAEAEAAALRKYQSLQN